MQTVKICPCGRHHQEAGPLCGPCLAKELRELQGALGTKEVMRSLSNPTMNSLRGGAVRIRMDERLAL